MYIGTPGITLDNVLSPFAHCYMSSLLLLVHIGLLFEMPRVRLGPYLPREMA